MWKFKVLENEKAYVLDNRKSPNDAPSPWFHQRELKGKMIELSNSFSLDFSLVDTFISWSKTYTKSLSVNFFTRVHSKTTRYLVHQIPTTNPEYMNPNLFFTNMIFIGSFYLMNKVRIRNNKANICYNFFYFLFFSYCF